jgi:tetratricopeptide (TPR) repeat protein
MIRLLLAASAFLLLAGCLHAPPIHPRAKEANVLCAQYLAQGDLQRAEVECDLGLEFSPHYADLWNNKGMIKLRQGQIDEAEDDFKKALRYNQEQAQAYNNLGYIYLKQQKLGKAHDSFERALKVNPDFIEARYNLALTWQQMNKAEEAKKELRTIIAIKPQLADPHYSLGQIELEHKAFDAAIEELTRAIQLSPDYAQAWLALGNAYSASGKYSQAKDAYTSCLRYDKDSIECRNNLPLVARKAALLDPSLQEAKDESATENTPAALYSLALTYRESGLKKEEERTYKKCLTLDGRYAPCHYGLYQIFRDNADDHNASIACKNFLKFASADDFPKEVDTCERFLQSGAN